jgi:hypothetical protein
MKPNTTFPTHAPTFKRLQLLCVEADALKSGDADCAVSVGAVGDAEVGAAGAGVGVGVSTAYAAIGKPETHINASIRHTRPSQRSDE